MSLQRTRRVAVLSGKGGVGKTNLVANVALAASALPSRVLVVDGDLGLANVDVLLGIVPRTNVSQVIDGGRSFEEAIVEGPGGIHLLAAASGRSDLPGLGPAELARLLLPILSLEDRYELVLVDAGSGIGASVVSLAGVCDQAMLVLSGEPTSLADAYATLKVLARELPELPVEIVVNDVANETRARECHARLARMAERFLGASPPFAAWVPEDPRVPHAVAQQRAVVELFPDAPASRAYRRLAHRLHGDAPTTPIPNPDRPGAPARHAPLFVGGPHE